jgi:hypothetical protein
MGKQETTLVSNGSEEVEKIFNMMEMKSVIPKLKETKPRLYKA